MLDIQKNQILLKWHDCVFTKIYAHDSVRRKIFEYLSIGKKFVNRKLVKLGIEDSKHRFYDNVNDLIYRGHIKSIYKFAKEFGYNVVLDENIKTILSNHPKHDMSFVDGLEIWGGDCFWKLFDHQRNAIEFSLNKLSGVMLSATGSGKTLITYCIIRDLIHRFPNQKFLITTPNVSLINQMFKDFELYSLKDDNFHVKDFIQKNDNKRIFDKQVLVGTPKGIYNRGKEFLNQFNGIIVDEVHGVNINSNTLSNILKKCTNAYTRIGMTGSLNGDAQKIDHASEMLLYGLFGDIKTFSKTSDLVEKDILPNFTIQCLELCYNKTIRNDFDDFLYTDPNDSTKIRSPEKIELYNLEREYMRNNLERRSLVSKVIKHANDTSICLFNGNEYGKTMYDILKNEITDREIYFVDKDVKIDKRSEIYDELIPNNPRCILVASFGTTKVGLSVKEFKYGFMMENFKSRSTVIQSIGRLLRGEDSMIFDFGDKFSSGSLLYKHFKQRKQLYLTENYKYKEKKVII